MKGSPLHPNRLEILASGDDYSIVNDVSSIETGLGPVIGHVQTDTFCEGCGYNLHTQAVVRDERLGILVCRCPECGRYTAAGHGTSAARVWLNRLATVLLIWWVLFLLVLFGLCTLFEGMVAYAHVRNQLEWQQDPLPTTNRFSGMYYRGHYVVRHTPPEETDQLEQEREEQIIITCVAGGLGFINGSLFAVLLWHCKGWRRLFALLPPVIGCGIVILPWNGDISMRYVRDWAVAQVGLFLLLESAAVVVGLFIGRPIARGVFRILIPPKLRQHLAFLWTVDGKRLAVEPIGPATPASDGRPIRA